MDLNVIKKISINTVCKNWRMH